MVARSFRYMRRKPTIMAYRTPTGNVEDKMDHLLSAGFFAETIEEEDLCSSNHFILDRIAEKESTENLHRSGSEHEEVEDADIRQVGDDHDGNDDNDNDGDKNDGRNSGCMLRQKETKRRQREQNK